MRILMTGSHGLVGTVMAGALAGRGDVVVPFDVIADPADDIRDRDRLARALEGCDGIVHLAAMSRVAWGESHPALTHDINVEGTRAVIDVAMSARPRPWLLFASSREIYGNPVERIIDETAPTAPVNHYGRSKAAGEDLVNAARVGGMRTAMLRLSNVYGGRRDHPDRAVPALVARALAGEDLTITGADNYFDFVHVEDTVAGLIAAMEQLESGESALPAMHLATGRDTSLGQLAELAIRATASGSRIIPVAARAFDVAGFCGRPDRARELLGWLPTVSIEEGVRRVAQDLAENGPLPPAHIPVAG